MVEFDYIQIITIVLSLIAVILSIYRFQREMTVMGSIINFLSIEDLGIKSHYKSKQSRMQWIFHFDLIFFNSGDRNGVLIIEEITGVDINLIGSVLKNGLIEPEQFPIVRPILNGEFISIRMGIVISAHPDKIKEETLNISYRTWKKEKISFLRHVDNKEKKYEITQVLKLISPSK